MTYIYENFDVKDIKFINENKSLKEGVLSKVKGPSFFLDGYSRNGRFYPSELWDNALKNNETQTKLKRGLMFGCIGHPKDYSLDELLESGKVSHKVVDIKVDKKTGVGIAEYEILDTPSGRILDTVLKSGSNMYVSTRAFGGFSNETKEKDGKKYKVLNKDNFMLESIDFVIDPGFLETDPQLMESIKEDLIKLSEDEHHIECVDGICSLNVNEVIEEIDELEDLENKNNDIEEMKMEIKDLEKLEKNELITILNNVIKENQLLSENSENIENSNINENYSEINVNKKILSNYISYIELLMKLIRYNIDYEKFYEELVEIIDKDDKLTLKDMETIDKILDEILKQENIDDSIIEISNNIKKLFNIIKNPKDDENDEEKSEEFESFIDYMQRIKTKVIENVIENDDISNIEEQQKIINQLTNENNIYKKAIQSSTQKIEELNKKSSKVETIYEIPESVNNDMIRLSSEIQEVKSENENLLEVIKEDENKIDSLTESINKLNNEIKEYKERINLIKEDYNNEINILINEKNKIESKINNINEKNIKVIEINNQLNEELFETKALYNAALYKLDLPLVKKMMEMYNDNQLKGVLEKEQKLKNTQIKNESIEIPVYKPNNEDVKKYKSLKSLI